MDSNTDSEVQFDTSKYATLNDPVRGPEVNDKDLEYLNSAKTWNELNIPEDLYEQLVKLGFKNPSRIQALVIKTTRNNPGVVAQSQNGSGKTLAFMIPALMSIDPKQETRDENGQPKPQVIILADTNALIQQLRKVARKLIDGWKDYRVGSIWHKNLDDLEENPHIQISTSHQIQNLTGAKQKINLSGLKYLILDECDMVMANDKAKSFLPQQILKKMNPQAKIILISATLTINAREMIEKMQEHRTFVESLTPIEQQTLKNVSQFYMRCESNERFQNIDNILKGVSASNILIFANSKVLLQKVYKHLDNQGYKIATVYSDMNEANRAETNSNNIDEFLQGKYRILATTNLLARGIDMRKVTLVINLEFPKKFQDNSGEKPVEVDPETYLHRVGRTGRFGDHGIAVNFVCNSESDKQLNEIMAFYKSTILELKIDAIEAIELQLKEIDSYNIAKRAKLEEGDL